MSSIGQTFVSYAREDQAFALEVATVMRNRGVPIWIDQWNIEPGADWNKAIDAALHACANFLIVLSPDATKSDEVMGELRVALNGRKRVIPLLYRPSDIPRQLLLKQHLDFTQSPRPSEALLDRLARVLRDEENGDSPDRDSKSRQTLLQDVKGEVSARLRSTGTETPIPILLEHQPYQVAPSWDDDASVSVRQRPRPPVTDIVEVFDDAAVGGKLLILGAPGAGKTTVALQLMQELVARADQDGRRPIPVLLNLTSWKNDKPIGDWFVDELKLKYGVRADLGRRWRDEASVAPIFDGLDELPADLQHACVEAIDVFQQEYRPPSLVVCCRRAEYENLTVKLHLHGAVCLLPFETGQIRDYLNRAGSSDLWNAIRGDPQLLEMARSPLLLSFMSALPDEAAIQRWQDAPSATERRWRVFDTYVSSHASSDVNPRAYSREQTLRWLRQVAMTLRRQGQAEFLVERMQPEWLKSSLQRGSYRAGVLGASVAAVVLVMRSTQSLFGLIPQGQVGLALQSKFSSFGEALDWPLLLVIAAAIGFFVASRNTIVPVETVTWSWSRAWSHARRWAQTAALGGLDYGTALGVVAGLVWFLVNLEISDDARLAAARFAAAAGGVLAAIFLALIKPSAWLLRAQPRTIRPRVVDGARPAIVFAALTGWGLLWGSERLEILVHSTVATLTGLCAFAIVGLSRVSNDRGRGFLLSALTIGTITGVVFGAVSAMAARSSVALFLWVGVWGAGGLSVGVIAGMMMALIDRARERRASTDASAPESVNWTFRKTVAAGVALGIGLGLAAIVLARAGNDQTVRDVGTAAAHLHGAFLNALVTMILSAVSVATGGAIIAGMLGALTGALGGATGIDVERRLVPNQGIHQSAVNVAIFAALGTLVIGVPYGLFNVTVAAFAAGMLPTSGDWLRMGGGAGATFGLLAGLLPGAACIQHFILRLVLWASGTLPLRYVRFLNFATRRRLLQRVGGRYRFIHVLLRDYLGDTASARTAA